MKHLQHYWKEALGIGVFIIFVLFFFAVLELLIQKI